MAANQRTAGKNSGNRQANAGHDAVLNPGFAGRTEEGIGGKVTSAGTARPPARMDLG
jgi:hypothetical protein